VKWRANLRRCCRCSLTPLITSSGLDWKLGHRRHGFSARWHEAGLSVICVETRHMRAVLKAQINKTDRNDARGIAQMMRPVLSEILCLGGFGCFFASAH
jgi:hypothetical protein